MKLKSWILAFTLALAAIARGATNDLTGLLQKGLFEEEANRNLDAAISEYQSLASAFDKDRQVAATAIFRLGECYRKLSRTNDAIAEYERIVRDFPDQSTLVTLSRQNLEGLGRSAQPPSAQQNAPDAEHAKELEIVKRLKNMPLDQVRQVAPTLLTDATLINLIYQFNQSELNITRLLTDHGPDHPEVKKEQAMQVALKTKIYERLDGLVQALSLEMEVSGAAQKESVAANGSNAGVTDDEEKQIRNIQAMIQNSPDLINAADSDGNTPLETAAAKGQLVVAKYLIDHGADVNGRSLPLYSAVSNGHKAMVELLLARGADVNARNPLYRAISKGFNEVAEVLLANKADVNLGGNNGESPLDAAARTGNTELVQSLIRHGADVNAKDVNGYTPLFAASANQTAVAKILIAAKADIEAKDKAGETPLHDAASAGSTAMVSLLLDSGANVDATNVNDTTPLLLAIAGGHVDATHVLLEHKADPNHIGLVRSVASDRQPPVIMAILIRNNEILQLLLDAGANPEGNSASGSPLFTAIGQNNVDATQLLLQHGADANRADNGGNYNGNPPLVTVVWNRLDKRMVPLLLNKGADPNGKNSYGYTPLFLTTDPEIGRQLIEHKADVNARGPNGDTPLIYSWSSPEYIKFLLANGANPDLQNTNGETALHMAVRAVQTNTVGILLENKANPNIQNNTGDTPLDLAKGLIAPFLPFTGPGVPARASVSHEDAEAMIAMLTKAGGLANLPKRDRIEVRRASNSALTISKDTAGRNRYSLLEAIATTYGIISQKTTQPNLRFPSPPSMSPFSGSSLPFPDFKKVIIYRRTENSTKQTTINVNVEDILNAGDCSRDIWLEWGDIVEVPEADHPVDQSWSGLTEQHRTALTKCVTRQVTVKIKGESTALNLLPIPEPPASGVVRLSGLGVSAPTSFMLRSVLNESRLIRVSSDLSRVKVTRVDPETKKTVEWIVDCTNPNQADLWLRDGDVIEVPEK